VSSAAEDSGLGLPAAVRLRAALSGSSILPLSLVTYSVSTALIVALACMTMRRERLRAYPHSPPSRRAVWLRPAAALSAGLLVGEPAVGLVPPGDVRPSRLRRTVLVASTGAIVVNLAVGGYVGYGLMAGP
jgi:hypothetical protein